MHVCVCVCVCVCIHVCVCVLWEGGEEWFGRKVTHGASLVVWWLRLGASNSGDLGSVPGQGTRSHMPQLRVPMLQLKLGEANK